jgi:hypothetical protein
MFAMGRTPAFAQTADAPKLAQVAKEDVAQAIDGVAKLCDRDVGAIVDELMWLSDFGRRREEDVWGRISPLKQVEVAYLSAERARKGQGRLILAHLVQRISDVDAGIQKIALLKPLLKIEINAKQVQFEHLPSNLTDVQKMGAVPAADRAIIELLVNIYCTR